MAIAVAGSNTHLIGAGEANQLAQIPAALKADKELSQSPKKMAVALQVYNSALTQISKWIQESANQGKHSNSARNEVFGPPNATQQGGPPMLSDAVKKVIATAIQNALTKAEYKNVSVKSFVPSIFPGSGPAGTEQAFFFDVNASW